MGPPLGSKAGPNCSCPLSHTLPRNFLTRTLRNYSHRHPSTHYTHARLNSRVPFHKEIKDGTEFGRFKRGVGAVQKIVQALRDVWVLVELPTYNRAHPSSEVGAGWAFERSCFMHECDCIHMDTIACSHLLGQIILSNLVGIRFHYLMTTLDYKHT